MARISEFEFSGSDSVEVSLTQAEYDAMIAASGTASEIDYTVQQYDLVINGGTSEFQVSELGSANSTVTFNASSTWVFDTETQEWVTGSLFSTNTNVPTNFNPTSTGTSTTSFDSIGLFSSQNGADTPIQIISISQDGVPVGATIADGPLAGGSATIEHYDWDSLAQPVGSNYLEWNLPDPTNPVFSTGAGFGTDSGVCFVTGTLIATTKGETRVEDLRIGDKVVTHDRGCKPIKWIGSSYHTAATLDINPKLRPIRIKKGALGSNIPTTDLTVSPQHRILVQSKIAKRMVAEHEVLVAACALLPLEGVEVVNTRSDVTYYHVMCDQHEVLMSNGAWTESLYAGKEALKAISPKAREELWALMPELHDFDSYQPPKSARPILEGRKRRTLVKRHIQNFKPITDHSIYLM